MTALLGAGPESDPAREAARLAILKAAERCFSRFGLTKTTMEDIARAAGMSRATVYRYFADREALVLASVMRRARADMPRARRHLSQFGTFGEQLVGGMVRNVERGRGDPVGERLGTAEQRRPPAL